MALHSPILAPALAFLDVGGPELLLIMVLILLLFGGKRMPELARGLGKSIRDFKRATAGVEDQLKRALEEEPVGSKTAKQIADKATTTPEDTSVYDEAAAAATAASADAPADATDSDAQSTAATDDAPQPTNDYEDVDPYEDEYIGGSADSDAGAHGLDDDEKKTASGQNPKKETPPNSGAADGDGGGI